MPCHFLCFGLHLLGRQVEVIFHPVSKEVRNNKYRKTPVICDLTIPPHLCYDSTIYLFKVVPRYDEPRCNGVLSITNGCFYPSNSKIYELKEPRYNETSSKRTYFDCPLALRYVEVLLCNNTVNNNIPARSLPLISPLFSSF